MADLWHGMWNIALQPLKTLYHHYHNAYDHQTYQGGGLPWGAPTHKVTWSFGHVSSDIMWQTKNISVAKVPIANKPSRMVTCLEGPLSIKLVDPLLTWSYEITAQIKTFISPLPPFTKLGKMVIYVERLSTMKLPDPN